MNLLMLLFLTTSLKASNLPIEVVYGEDNRAEPYERPMWWQHSRSAAAMIGKDKLSKFKTGVESILATGHHRNDYSLCPGQKFENQPNMATCSGFLVAPDVIMTAGHCIDTKSDCDDNFWVFDYEMQPYTESGLKIEKRNVYACKSIIVSSNTPNKPDYALIKLDRATDRLPLKLQDPQGSSEVGDRLVMMGYPSGLPLKITDNAQVLRTTDFELVTDLDAFNVNSGSAVMDEQTGKVVGILVSGAQDYRRHASAYCMTVNRVDSAQGTEKVTSIQAVPRTF